MQNTPLDANVPNPENITLGYKDLILYQTDVLKNSELIKKSIEGGANALINMDKSTSSLIRGMGVTSSYAEILKNQLGRANTEISLMGGNQEAINTLQKEFNEVTNRNIVLTTENITQLYAAQQVTGVAAKTLESSFRNAGMETTHISDEMTKVVSTAQNMGVNAQVVSAMVVTNLDKMNRYGFGKGVEGMAKMAAKAAAMRVDMAQTLNVADKLFSPESAIDVASTLQRLGATSSALLDPLKLMDLAQNNVPELQNQLSELSKTFTKFDEKTGTFQIMPEARRQLKEVADSLGIDRAEFEKMAIESAKIEKKMGEIDFKGLENVPEDQKMMLANIAEFNKNSGKYEVTYKDANGAVTTQALNNLQKGDIDLIAQQQEFQKKDSGSQMVDLAKDQLGAANTLVAQQNALTSLLSTQYAISKEGNEFLRNAVNGQTEILKSGFETFSLTTQKGKDNSQQLIGDIQGRVNKVVSGDISITEITSLLADFSQGFETLKPIMDDAVKIATENTTKVVISEALKASSSFEEGAKKFGINVGDFGNAVTKLTILGSAVTNWAKEKLGITEEKKDIAITADGMHYSLDKGDMLMAVNQKALASSIGGNVGPLLPSNEGQAVNNTTSGKKELVLTLNVNANSNDPQIKNAILSAFNNDDTLRTLREKIGVVGSDYGLTAT